MAKRKLSDEPNRKFVHKTEWSEVTETICVEIQNFTEKIDNLDNKKKLINSPKFTLAGNELSVCVYPEDNRENSGEFIGVYLNNDTKESITVTATFESSDGEKFFMKRRLIKAGGGRGRGKFLSHDVYKKWARDNEDIFSLEVKVTLHVKSPGTWTTER